MKEDGAAKTCRPAKAACFRFELLNPLLETFGAGVGDRVTDPRQQTGPVACKQVGDFRQVAVAQGPDLCFPVLEKVRGGGFRRAGKEVAKGSFQAPHGEGGQAVPLLCFSVSVAGARRHT